MNHQSKEELRAEIKGLLSRMPEEEIRANSKAIGQQVMESSWFQEAKTLFIYLNTAKEPETKQIILEAFKLGKTVLVPKCLEPGKMAAVPIQSLEECKSGAYGILEPEWNEDKLRLGEEIWKQSLVLGLIPCLSAGRDGGRLGHGAGYYDRFFMDHSCTCMALCFEALRREAIPMTVLDHPMDLLAAETGIFSCDQSFKK